MKEVFHRIMIVFMAFVVFFSTMSFTVGIHYCGDTIVETAILKKAKGCGMEMETPATESCSVTKESCCSDEQIIADGQDELQQSVNKISFEQQIFIASFVYTYINLFEYLDKNVSSFEEYKPPLVVRQIFKIDETYLI